MNVIAFNGSPQRDGNTHRLIRHVLDEIERAGIETGIVQIGGKKVHPCIACGKCLEKKDRRCIQDNDMVNECIEQMLAAERRSGAVCAVDTVMHYFTINGMFSAGSRYWNNAKGFMPGDVESDEEGIDTMKQLGENIAWFIKKTRA